MVDKSRDVILKANIHVITLGIRKSANLFMVPVIYLFHHGITHSSVCILPSVWLSLNQTRKLYRKYSSEIQWLFLTRNVKTISLSLSLSLSTSLSERLGRNNILRTTVFVVAPFVKWLILNLLYNTVIMSESLLRKFHTCFQESYSYIGYHEPQGWRSTISESVCPYLTSGSHMHICTVHNCLLA